MLGIDGLLRVLFLRSTLPFLAAVDGEDGATLWENELETVHSGPVIGPDGTTFVVYRKHIVAFDPQGGVRWRTQLPPDSDSNPAAEGAIALTGDGVLVVSRRNTWMYGFDMDGMLLWTTRIFIQSDPAIAVAADGAILVAGRPGVLLQHERNGLLRWETPFPAPPRIAIAPEGLRTSLACQATAGWWWARAG